MEKLYSKSIFSSSSFLAHTSLSAFSSTTFQSLIPQDHLTGNNNINNTTVNTNINTNTDAIIAANTDANTPINAPTTLTSTPFNSLPSLRCNSCSVSFEDAKEQHDHYKSLWHTFNLKLRLSGATAITKEEFVDLGEESGGSSESEDSSSNSESEKENTGGKLHQFLKKEAAAFQSSEGDIKPRQAKAHKLAFLAQQGGSQVVISVWRCLLGEDVGDDGGKVLLALQNASNNTKWTILLCSGGRFAGAVFVGNSCVEHKAMHRYTVRKKQGGSQSSRDATGNAPKSAGASLRRYNETRLREDIAEILQAWKEHISTSHYIFYFAPKGAPRSMLIFDGSPLQLISKGPKLRKIPIPIKRPTYPFVRCAYALFSSILSISLSIPLLFDFT